MLIEDIVNRAKKAGEYLPVIALVPLILGGFWQMMELASMSSSYIRFFSVTQQLADGLLILFVATMIYLAFLIIKSFSKTYYNPSVEDIQNLNLKEIASKFFRILLFLGVTTFFMKDMFGVIFKMMNDIPNGVINLGQLVFISVIILGIFSIPIKSLIIIMLGILRKYTGLTIRVGSNAKSFFIALLVIAFIRFTFEFFPVFHSAYMVPKNLTNVNYILDKYAKEHSAKNKKNLEVAYMNDKYIFIRDSSSIEVVKIDYMFRENK